MPTFHWSNNNAHQSLIDNGAAQIGPPRGSLRGGRRNVLAGWQMPAQRDYRPTHALGVELSYPGSGDTCVSGADSRQSAQGRADLVGINVPRQRLDVLAGNLWRLGPTPAVQP